MPTTFDCPAGPVAGIDTHTDTHTVAVISDTGRQSPPTPSPPPTLATWRFQSSWQPTVSPPSVWKEPAPMEQA
ncbi:hypothetical protein [Corynebacterium diphtheriae]|uniref:hypothetical protein n=1 Tax=Corynebacterium diphtheriae TaxID=1717 RepID=UPI003F74A484